MGTFFRNLNGWGKAFIAMILPIVAFAVAFGQLQSNVQHNHDEIGRIEESIDHRLERMEDKLDRLIAGGP